MDEVRMVRDGYPEYAPPTAQAIARAKAMLNEPPRRSSPRLRWGLGGVVAAGAAATVAFTLVGGNTPGGGNPPAPPRSVYLDNKGAILTAAEQAERQPAGDYWHTDLIMGQSYVMRPETGTYAITGALTEGFNWWGAKSGMGEAFYSRELPSRPSTTGDAALWRKAGSPSSFRVWSSDHFYTYTTKATKWQVDGKDSHGGGFLGGKSAEDLQNLPADPAKLTAMFLSQTVLSRQAAGLAPGRQPSPELARRLKTLRIEPQAKVSAVAGLLNSPLPPKVRAGLMRALADQQGVRAIGHATDPMGRRGVALASVDRAVTVTGEYGAPKAEQGTYRSRSVIIFDERTGALLSTQDELTKPGGPYATMKPGFVIHYTAARSAKWTDTKPQPLAELPFS
jgi:hypothetical protein